MFFFKQLQSGYTRYVVGLGIVATLGGLAYYYYTRRNGDNRCTRNCRCGYACRCGKNCTCPELVNIPKELSNLSTLYYTDNTQLTNIPKELVNLTTLDFTDNSK